MSKFSNYVGTIQLISGIKQANNQNFALIESNAVQVDDDGKRLDSFINEAAHTEVVASLKGIISDFTGDPISKINDGLYLLSNLSVSDDVAIISLSGNVDTTITVQDYTDINLFKFKYGESYVFVTINDTLFTMQLRYDVSDKMDKFATIEEYQGEQTCIKSVTDDLIILSGDSSSGIYLRSNNHETVVRSGVGLILSAFDSDNSLSGTRLTLGNNYIKFNGPSEKSDIPTIIKGVANPTTDYEAANKTYVDNKVASIVNSAPETLDTLQELAEALGNDPNFAATMATELGKKLNKSDVDQSYNSESINPQSGIAVAEIVSQKVDKISGKGLSTNDYTTTEKTKLAGIETGANKTAVDSTMSDTSVNPVQNKVIKSYVDAAISSGVVVDDSLSTSSVHPVQNKIITVALNNKQDTLTEGVGINISDDNIISVNVDQDYDSTSTNPQSGIAVAEAISNAISSITPEELGALTESDTLILNCNAAIGIE